MRTSFLALAIPLLASPGRAQQFTLHDHAGAPGAELGRSVASLGDIDGDGVPDYALGAPGDAVDPVRVVSGATGLVVQAFQAPAGSRFGGSMAAVGDIDGDGRSELAVAATTAGFVQLLSPSTASVLWTWTGPVREVSRLGDVDGDGIPDVLVLSASGTSVTLLSGASGNVVRTVALPGPYLFADGGEDVDGDGRGDFILGNPFYPGTSGSQFSVADGRVRVHSGADGSLLHEYVGVFITSEHTGYGVLMLGDVNGDGHADFAMGVLRDYALLDTGRVHVASGLGGGLLHVIHGPAGFGAGVFPAGDVDGDGVQDMHVRSGSTLRTHSGLDGSLLSPGFTLPFTWDWFDIQGARAVRGAGDLTGNSRPEVIAGHGSDGAGGRAVVLSHCTAATTHCVAAPNSFSASGALLSSGRPSVAANAFWLGASGVPPGMTGIFLYGKEPAQIPFGNGTLCLAPAAGLFRILPHVTADASGTVLRNLDLAAFSQPPGALVVGTTWSFQLWYRDVAAGGAGTNLSNARRVTFCP